MTVGNRADTDTRFTQKGLGKTFCSVALPRVHPCLRESQPINCNIAARMKTRGHPAELTLFHDLIHVSRAAPV